MKQTKHALLVGVGGQGVILTAKVLVNGLMRAGYDVKIFPSRIRSGTSTIPPPAPKKPLTKPAAAPQSAGRR